MKKLMLGLLFILLIGSVSAAVRINEYEANPAIGEEWIELYSDSEVNLSGWNLTDSDDSIMELDFNFSGYYVLNITFNLRNSDDNLTLIDNNGSVAHMTPTFEDSITGGVDNLTWQYCGGVWNFSWFTPDAANNCTAPEDPDPDPDSGGSDQDIELSWNEDEIINGEEFEIKIKTTDLSTNKDYDVMVWIIESGDCEDESSISERYGNYSKEDVKWADGKKWVYGFLEDGDEYAKMKVRIDESDRSFSGNAKICTKMRLFDDGSDIIDEWDDTIKILEAEEEDDEGDDSSSTTTTTSTTSTTSTTTNSAIRLGGSDSEDGENETENSEGKRNSIIYKSKNEYIKEWSIYIFAFICIGIIILLLIERR